MTLNNEKYALVTGASSGLGRETAINLAKSGHTVILLGRNKKRLEQTQNEIKKEQGKSLILKADIRHGGLKEKIEELIPGQKIDLLVHAASILYLEDESFTMERKNEIGMVNYHGAIDVVDATLLRIKNHGSIVVVLSVAAILDFGKIIRTYSESKKNLGKEMNDLRQLLKEKNIQITLVYPPLLDTSMVHNLGPRDKLPPVYRAFKWRSAKEMASAMIKDVMMRREESYIDGNQRLLAVIAKQIPKIFSWAIRIYARTYVICKFTYKHIRAFIQKHTQKQ